MLVQFIKEISAAEKFPLYIRVKIIPGAQSTTVAEKMKNGDWKIKISAPPEKGKANLELLKFLQKKGKITAEIIYGHTGRTKLLKITNAQNIKQNN